MDGAWRNCVFEAGETARSHRKVALSDSFRVRHGDEFAKLLGGGVVAVSTAIQIAVFGLERPRTSLRIGTGAGAAAAALFPATASPVPAPGVVTGCPHLRQNCDSSGSSVLHLLQDRAIAEGTPAVT